MDQNVTLEELKLKVKKFADERNWEPFHTPKDLAIGVVTEGSELLEIFRFLTKEQEEQALQDPSIREAIGDELSDTLYFLLRFAELYRFDLSEAFERKLLKNARKYPAPSL